MSETTLAAFVWNTIEQAEASADRESLEAIIGDAFARLGADVYVGVEARGTLNGAEVQVRFGRSSPEWEARYFEAGHAAHDPMVRHMLSSSEPLYWSDIAADPTLTPRQRRVFEEARAFGLHEGVAVPLHHPGGSVSAVLLMGAGLNPKDAGQRRAAVLLSNAFSRAARRLKLGAAPFDPTTPRLTRREAEALYWVRKGAADKAIGHLMGLSHNTVANYVRAAQYKLGVSGRGAAAQLAADLGVLPAFINPPDGS